MNNDINKIFTPSACPSEDMLLLYAEGKLSETEKKEIEKHLIDCEMCNDEVEGLMLIGDQSNINVIESEINTRIDKLLVQQKKTNFSFIFKIAASILLFAGLSTIIYFQFKNVKHIDIAEYNETDIEEKNISEEESGVIDSIEIIEDNKISASDERPDIDESPQQRSADRKTSTGMANKEPQTVHIYTDDIQFENDIAYAPVEESVAETDKTEQLAETRNDGEKKEDESVSKNAETVTISYTQALETTVASGKKKDFSKEKSNKNRHKETASQTGSTISDAEAPPAAEGATAGLVSGDALNSNQELQLAIENINTENYNIALQLLETPKFKDSKDEKVLYYKALCFYKLNNFQKAYSIFKEIMNSESTLKYNIQWYYALSLLAIDKKEEAKKQLEEIINSSSPFVPAAQEELDKLK